MVFGFLESRFKVGGIERSFIDFNFVFKYDLGIEREGKFYIRISWDFLKFNEY